MAEKPLPWFRAYHESAFDPKFDIASAQTGLHHLIVFGAWWKLLCLAGSSPVRGTLHVTSTKRFSNADVAALLRLSTDECEKVLQSFVDLDMIDIDKKSKTISIRNWDKRQFGSDSSTNRVKKYRENHKPVTPAKRFSNVSVTPPDTDTESDTESDKELVVEEGADTDFSKVWTTYENIFGSANPVMADELHDAIVEFTADWVVDALGEMTKNGKRSWKYARKILENWKTYGYRVDTRKNGNGGRPTDPPLSENGHGIVVNPDGSLYV